MTLYVVGNVDSRNLSEQINKTFSALTGKRETPAPLPTLSPLPHEPVNLRHVAADQIYRLVRQRRQGGQWRRRFSFTG